MKTLTIILILTLCIAFTGCGVTGRTSTFKVEYPTLTVGPEAKDVNTNVVAYQPGAAVTKAVGAYQMGSFGPRDLESFKVSLEDTISQFNSNSSDFEKRYHVNAMVQKYMLSYTNARMTGLIAVDWCLAKDGNVLHQERVFATVDTGNAILIPKGTLGTNKDKMNRLIIRHIANKTFNLLHGFPRTDLDAGICLSLEEAVNSLPEDITSVGFYAAPIYYHGERGTTDFKHVDIEPEINWDAFLK